MSWYIYDACNLYPTLALAIMPVLFQILVSVEILCTTCERIDWRRGASKQWSCIRFVIRWYLCPHIGRSEKASEIFNFGLNSETGSLGVEQRWWQYPWTSALPDLQKERVASLFCFYIFCIVKLGEGRELLWVRPRGGFAWAPSSPPAYPWTRWSWCPEIRFVCVAMHFSWNTRWISALNYFKSPSMPSTYLINAWRDKSSWIIPI